MNVEIKNILLVRTDRIGDVILSLPMLPLIKRHFPHARISVLVRNYTKELVEQHSCVDEILIYEHEDNVSALLQTLKRIRARNFDLAILPYPRFRSTLLVFLSGIRTRVGTGYRWYSFLFNRKVYEHRKDAKRHEVEYNLNLLKSIDIEPDGPPKFELSISGTVQKGVEDFLSANAVAPGENLAVLHPGSGGSARDWSPENFSKLGDLLRSQMGMKIAVTGGKGEEELVKRVARGMSVKPLEIVGRFSLKELAALARRARVFISNSTGPMHIAAIVGTPIVAFFPPILQCSPVRWGPYTAKKKVFVADNASCTLCHGGPCRSIVCMDQIKVEDVVRSVRELLNES